MEIKTRINLGLEVAMAALLMLMQLPQGIGVQAHQILGIVMGAGAIIHVALHRKWIASVCKSFSKLLPAAVRVNLFLDILLLTFFALTCISGLFNAPLTPAAPGSRYAHVAFIWHAIHNLSAHITLFITIIHVVLHRKWITSALRRSMSWSFQTTPGQ